MEEEFAGKGVIIKSLGLVKKGGNEYTGVLETKEPYGDFTYAVEVVCDGDRFSWRIEK
jgi:hypothetical protein